MLLYSMAIYKYSKSIITNLHSHMEKLWKNQFSDQFQLTWNSWNKLCQLKFNNGLGFQDLHHLNQCILTRDYRLIHHLLPLKFSKANICLSPQVAPNNLPTSRRVYYGGVIFFLRALVDQFGNGLRISVWYNRWVPS